MTTPHAVDASWPGRSEREKARARAGRLTRYLWIVGVLTAGRTLRSHDYFERFSLSHRSLMRDMRVLREAGFLIDHPLGAAATNPDAGWRLIIFRPELEAV